MFRYGIMHDQQKFKGWSETFGHPLYAIIVNLSLLLEVLQIRQYSNLSWEYQDHKGTDSHFRGIMSHVVHNFIADSNRAWLAQTNLFFTVPFESKKHLTSK